MKLIIKNIFKYFIFLFLSHSVTMLCAMTLKDINHVITIKNKVNDRNSLLQLSYLQNELGQHAPVGQNQILSAPHISKYFCGPILTLSDPYSKEKNLYFKVIDGSSLTIHKKEYHKIRISGSQTALFVFKKNQYDEMEESILASADEKEKDLACFTYNRS